MCRVPPDQRQNLCPSRPWPFRTHQYTQQKIKEQEKHGAAKREDSWVHPINNFAWRHHEVNIWLFVLKSNNVHRQSLVDQVIAAAVPESPEPQKTSVAVKAFLDVDLPAELIKKTILEPSPFNDNGSLQNLLMLTAAKADKGYLMDYIQRLSEFNAEEIANMYIDQGLFEEAFEIYKKVDNYSATTNVLVDHIVGIDRAQEYAERVELPEVWSKVVKAHLDGLRVTDPIDSYIKA
jgi:clathrin heavy chain